MSCPQMLFRLLLLAAAYSSTLVSGETYVTEMLQHGYWVEGRTFGINSDISCTLPITTPVKHFRLTLNTSAEFLWVNPWGLGMYGNSDNEIRFYSKWTMYPPRAVFHIHLTTFSREVTGTCTFEIFDEVQTLPTTTPLSTTEYDGISSSHRPYESSTIFSSSPMWESSTFERSTAVPQTRPFNVQPKQPKLPEAAGPCYRLSMLFPKHADTPVEQPEPFSETGETTPESSPVTDPPSVGRPGGRPLPPKFPGGDKGPPNANEGLPGRDPRPRGGPTELEPDSQPPSKDKIPPELESDNQGLPSRGRPFPKLPMTTPKSGLTNPFDKDGSQSPNVDPLPEILYGTIDMNYTRAIELSLYFYTAQKSGDVKEPPRTPAQYIRSSGLQHAAPDGTDLTGGWYNGNDNVKMSFTMASALTVLGWGYHTWKQTYIDIGLADHMEETMRWPLDYLMKTYNNETETLYTMIGNLTVDRELWYRADDPMYDQIWRLNRWPVFNNSRDAPASDVAAEMASAFTISALAIDDDDYGEELKMMAKDLYNFAKKYPGTYSSSVPVAKNGYPDYTSTGYKDEMCVAAAMLYKAEGTATYLTDAEGYFIDETGFPSFGLTQTPEFFDWDNKMVACALLLYEATASPMYSNYVHGFISNWLQKETTPDGLAYSSPNGTLRYTANAAFIALMANEMEVFENDKKFAKRAYRWSIKQLDYMLGNNDMRTSYQTKYSDRYVSNPYHKTSACPHPAKGCGWAFFSNSMDNINVLPGALVGGPDRNGYHLDKRTNRIGNSVALDYNAGFQSALAGAQALKMRLEEDCYNIFNQGSPDSSTSADSSTTSTTIPTTQMSTYKTKPPTAIPARPTIYNYEDALEKSILFFDAQRNGPDPKDNRVPWRHWSYYGAAGFENWGWYDDGSAIRTTKVTAAAVTVLGWGAIKYKDSYATAGQLPHLYNSLRWALYFLHNKFFDYTDMHIDVKAGYEQMERAYWQRPATRSTNLYSNYLSLVEEPIMDMDDILAEVVTALAVGARVFRTQDAEYATGLEENAKEIYTLINKTADKPFHNEGSLFYSEQLSADDEKCVAAWWLYDVTGDISYYNDAIEYEKTNADQRPYVLTWSDRQSLCEILAFEHTSDQKYLQQHKRSMEYWHGENKEVASTPDNLAWYGDEPNNYAANAAFLALLVSENADALTSASLRNFARTQINYMLGDNDGSFSYVIGYGKRYPRRPHHRASSCPDSMEKCDWSIYNAPWFNPHELTGALVAGPNIKGYYEDVRSNYTMNRVSVIANAGLQSALAGLIHHFPDTGSRYPTTSPRFTPAATPRTSSITVPRPRPDGAGTQTSNLIGSSCYITASLYHVMIALVILCVLK